jgi:3-oxoacyl-[acyl-carrier protein] reductase
MTVSAGRSVVITGASRGLGRALADAFWADGANVLGVARDAAALGELASALAGKAVVAGQKIDTLPLDLAAEKSADAVVAHALSSFGRIDTLVCNAAIQGPIGRAWEVDSAAWRDTIAADLTAPASLALRAVPSFIASGRGRIIFLSGGGATAPRPHFSAYAAAKAGLVRFAETLAHELAGTGVTVNAVAPGAMPTGMLQDIVRAGEGAASQREVEGAARVLANANDSMQLAAKLCVFLASDAARDISGRLISAVWDRWEDWPKHTEALTGSDLYTLRRITGRDRGQGWGDR